MDLGFKGQLVAVAGASGALGQAICRGLLAEGARVVLLGRDPDRLRGIGRELGPDVATVVTDLDDEASFEGSMGVLFGDHGVPDVLISAAGSTERIGVDDIAADDFRAAFESKVIPNVRLVLGVGRAMSERGSGRIVVVSGVGGVQPMSAHLPGGAANAALSLFATGYARHLAASGVSLNVVNPGAVESPRLLGHLRASAGAAMTEDEARAALMLKIPAGRTASPDEVADVVLFVASQRASYLVSTSVNVDGGQVVGP